jgi:hypothetical protein
MFHTPFRQIAMAGIVLSVATSVYGETIYFGVRNGAPGEAFVIALEDPVLIAKARAIIAGSGGSAAIVWGNIIENSVPYNRPGPDRRPWGFYMDPKSIQFAFVVPTTCGAGLSTSFVNQHVVTGDIGKFLVGNSWCPKGSKVVAEIPPTEATPESLTPQDHGLPWPWAKRPKVGAKQ